MKKSPIIIIGSGIAGLHAALKIAEYNNVLIITKSGIASSNSRWAQGGIAAVLDQHDNLESHIEDTMIAGCHHNDYEAVKFMVEKGPEVIKELIEFGVNFELDGENRPKLTKEGGHSKSRIAYKGDVTGLEIEEKLILEINKNPNIEVMENCFVVDLIVDKNQCHGIAYWDGESIIEASANAVIIATGGLGQIYKFTSNPEIATGDGYAMAYRAEVKISDMEFIQFHPTVFVPSDGSRPFLISEALRGEGAKIVNNEGEEFLNDIDERGALAPRDIVAKAIFEESKSGQVYLDMRHGDAKNLKARFPYISEQLAKYSLSLNKDLIPIQPSAHFCCGGIKTDIYGRTSTNNLYAFGEVACTGVHGANRLASNSLLEALAFSMQIAEELKSNSHDNINVLNRSEWHFAVNAIKRIPPVELDTISDRLKAIMQSWVGVVRNVEDLKKAEIELLKLEDKLYGFCRGNLPENAPEQEYNLPRFWEILNGVQTGILITEAAKLRKVSLGGHQITD